MSATVTHAQTLQLTFSPSNYNNFNISCFGARDGSINLTVSGGGTPYVYQWSNGSLTEDLTGIPAGYYHVTVTDRNNKIAEGEITLTEPEQLSNDFVISDYPNGYNVSCYNCFNGSIYNFPSGGVTPYTYTWEDGPITKDRVGLGRGDYGLTIMDANGCTFRPEQFNLFEPDRSDWTMSGNAGSIPGSNFIGTSDNKDLVFKTNNQERFRINAIGTVSMNSLAGIGDRFVTVNSSGQLTTAPCDVWAECGNIIAPTNFIGSYNNEAVQFKVFSQNNQSPILTLKTSRKISIKEFENSAFGILYTDNLGDIYKIDYDGNPNSYLNGVGAFTPLPNSALIWQQNANSVYCNSPGYNLGWGTSSPASLFELKHNTGGGVANGITLTNVNSSNHNSEIKFKALVGGNELPQWAIGIDLAHSGQDNFFIYDNDMNSSGFGSTRLLINADGDIGVGTESPIEKFQIEGGNIFINSENTGLIVDEGGNKRVGFLKYSGKEGGIWRVEGQKFEIGRAMGVSLLPGSPTSLQTDMIIDGDGKVGLGVVPPSNSSYRLFVEDGIATRDIMVQATGWPDFVFDDQYPLLSIRELEQFIYTNKHLPNVPSECDILERGGYELGEMQTILLQKIEEQSLYIIDLQKQIDALKLIIKNK